MSSLSNPVNPNLDQTDTRVLRALLETLRSGFLRLDSIFKREYLSIGGISTYTVKIRGTHDVELDFKFHKDMSEGNFENRRPAPSKNDKIIVSKTMPLEKRKILYFYICSFFIFDDQVSRTKLIRFLCVLTTEYRKSG